MYTDTHTDSHTHTHSHTHSHVHTSQTYVQHLIAQPENAKKLIEDLEAGGHVYVCGGTDMGRDVMKAVRLINFTVTNVLYATHFPSLIFFFLSQSHCDLLLCATVSHLFHVTYSFFLFLSSMIMNR